MAHFRSKSSNYSLTIRAGRVGNPSQGIPEILRQDVRFVEGDYFTNDEDEIRTLETLKDRKGNLLIGTEYFRVDGEENVPRTQKGLSGEQSHEIIAMDGSKPGQKSTGQTDNAAVVKSMFQDMLKNELPAIIKGEVEKGREAMRAEILEELKAEQAAQGFGTDQNEPPAGEPKADETVKAKSKK